MKRQQTNNNDSRDRRKAPRLQPVVDAREATVWLSDGKSINVIINDVAVGGVGVLSIDRDSFQLELPVTIEYQGVRLTGTVVNITDDTANQVRIGIQYARSSSIAYSPAKSEAPTGQAAIRIGKVDDERLYLEQVDGSLEHRITLLHDQLREMLEFLASSTDDTHVMPAEPERIQLRVFESDKSFTITQGEHQLVGFGDIRQVLEPVPRT
jgi:hypothetical protein